MKKFYLAILFLPIFSFAQSPVTNSAGFGETVPNPACLACSGSEWNNEMNVTASDGAFSTTTLNQYNSCFQSTCYYSRYLSTHNYNFSIPANATIDTIFVAVVRRAATANTVTDDFIQLQKMSTLVGANLCLASVYWPTVAGTANYGSNAPLWLTTWTPADINDPGFGVDVAATNHSATQQTVGVDNVQVTIYYSTATGTYSVTSSPSEISWITSPEKNVAHVFVNGNSNCVSSLFDVSGNLLSTQNKNGLPAGENDIELSTSQLATGIYFWQIQVGDKIFTRKISVIENN